MALWVHVGQKRFMSKACETRGEVDTRRGFPAAALLIDDRDGPHLEPSVELPVIA
jgi:hypothetical protein